MNRHCIYPTLFLVLAALLWAIVSCSSRVEEVLPSSLKLSDSEMVLRIGETSRLDATVYPENATERAVIWSSTAEEKVSISADGQVSALSVGTAYAVARTANGLIQSCKVEVRPWNYAEDATLEHYIEEPENW